MTLQDWYAVLKLYEVRNMAMVPHILSIISDLEQEQALKLQLQQKAV